MQHVSTQFPSKAIYNCKVQGEPSLEVVHSSLSEEKSTEIRELISHDDEGPSHGFCILVDLSLIGNFMERLLY